MKPIIRVENLSKQYRIGARKEPYKTLRESLTSAVSGPFRRLRSTFQRSNGSASQHSDDTIWALKDVSFEVMPGEVVGVIGRNGAGKSTLLKILSRITEPTAGGVDLYGRVGSLLEVGTGFHPELTGRENICLNGAVLGMKKAEIERKFDDIVEFAEIEEFLDTPVKHYSSGMYVRLAFAVAAYLQPEILVVDEILAVGDIEFQKKCMGRMEDIAKGGSTVLIVSHNMGTVRSLCSKAILLERGNLLTCGSPDIVVNEYLGSSSVDSSERIVGDHEYVFGGSKVRVKRIKLLNSATEDFSVYWQQPIAVCTEIEVLEQIDDVSFGAGIKLLDGTWFYCTHHDDYNIQHRLTLEPGYYAIRFTLQNDLKPGIYKLCIGAHHHHYSKNLFHVEAVNFEVLDHSEKGLIPYVYNPGLVNGKSFWERPERLG